MRTLPPFQNQSNSKMHHKSTHFRAKIKAFSTVNTFSLWFSVLTKFSSVFLMRMERSWRHIWVSLHCSKTQKHYYHFYRVYSYHNTPHHTISYHAARKISFRLYELIFKIKWDITVNKAKKLTQKEWSRLPRYNVLNRRLLAA